MAVPSEKPEFPPLLPLGRHAATLDEIQAHCVDAFPLSKTRQKIMEGLRTVVSRLTRDLVKCELWIDGSFLTAKIDADDCDLVCRVSGEFYDSATEEQQATVDWVFGRLPVVALPGHRKVFVRRDDVARLLNEHTYAGSRVRP